MLTIKINVPEHNCEGCPYLKEHTVDHNYYGEKSRWETCAVFDTLISDHQKCPNCIEATHKQSTIKTTAKEIEQLVIEAHNHAVNELTAKFKMVFIGKHFEDLIDQIVDSCKEK